MAAKTFKIGEYCRGGIITVETTKTSVTIIGKTWDGSQGYSKNSNQSNAKEWIRREFPVGNSTREIDFFLCDLTTSYYAGKVLDWIKTKVEFKNNWD